MNINNKKILVTGGGTGIGFAIAKAFSGNGNKVILAGRREDVLKTATEQIENSDYIVADVTDEKSVLELVLQIKKIYGGLDILVNNAGSANPQPLDSETGIYEKAKFEMELNYLSVLRLTEALLPTLKQSGDAAIINIESIVSYVPGKNLATYSATKAALHSYSQSLRLTLEETGARLKVFEVFPPFVDTELTKSIDAEKLSPDEIADDVITAVSSDTYAIRSGKTKQLYELFKQSPEEAFKILNNVA